MTNQQNSTEQFPWMDQSLSPRERAEKLVAAMTLEQKIAQLHGAMNTINIYDCRRWLFDEYRRSYATSRGKCKSNAYCGST